MNTEQASESIFTYIIGRLIFCLYLAYTEALHIL